MVVQTSIFLREKVFYNELLKNERSKHEQFRYEWDNYLSKNHNILIRYKKKLRQLQEEEKKQEHED